MPKKAVQMLYNSIDLLQEPLSSYAEIYKSDRRYYESILNYNQLNEELTKAYKLPPMTVSECE